VISRIDPSSSSVTATLNVPPGLQGLVFDGRTFWAASYDSGELLRIDPAGGKILDRWEIASGPRDALLTADSIWVANLRAPTVGRLILPR
jgi:hypothetical protein